MVKPSSGAVLTARFDGLPSSLVAVRAELRAAVDNALAPSRLTDLLLIVNELATNAVEASPGNEFELVVTIDSAAITARVSNYRPRTQVPPAERPGARNVLGRRGRGLSIVRALATKLDVSEGDDGWVHVEAVLSRGP